MGGPIVRTGTTPNFWKNWEQVFGGKGKKKAGQESKASTPKAAVKTAKSSKKPSTKPAVGKKVTGKKK